MSQDDVEIVRGTLEASRDGAVDGALPWSLITRLHIHSDRAQAYAAAGLSRS